MTPVNCTIRLLSSSDSISELTRLLNRAYRVLADMGFNYTAAYQDDETTRGRIERGECYVLIDNCSIVGTVMLYPPASLSNNEKRSWYGRPGVAICGQYAIEPDLQGRGLGSMLLNFVEIRAAEIGAKELALDTAEGAAHLIHFYKQRGYRTVDFTQHLGKSYRSTILSKRL